VGTFPAGAQLSSIAISGRFAFVANFGSNDVTTLTITSTDFGLAVSLAQFSVAAAGMGPSSVAVDASGKFLYVTNQLSNDVSAFAVNQSTGKLTPISGSPFMSVTAPVFATTSM
jgi:6-phosphogluconolactonase